MSNNKAAKELTNCEKLIMKVVWEAKDDISTPDTIEQLKVRFGKEYARTTVVTFVQRLVEKGYVTTYRRGRVSYIRPTQSEEEYRNRMLQDTVNFWFDGDWTEMISALCSDSNLNAEEAEKIREIIDNTDR
ncbi:BlaI/MecI/CopY family transcriptional regulator [Roseburia sp. MUC/MUC-530-WT-4D]|uniref:BlaI/MecI/CopY family transcriptional regulator n=1 Tax=Roseburia porci TaxID=2605790 RepID=A0A6L5YUA5_9FIRM|nr:BlaI/MecI/CopY family transcriptional regulator [Roseburia porci]MDD6742637.1 BlaI/MecI/CopY family transcriptional regulator [Roseburia porci]MST75556.1 BlaI/MecI/CopY family transcriptional regulator [Roseburia porci]